MNEERIKRRLRIGILLCVVAVVLVIGVSMKILNRLQASLSGLVRGQMQAEITDYSDRITRQIEKDFQALETVAVILEENGSKKSEEIIQGLHKANQKNNFVTMAYFDRNGIGAMSHVKYGVRTGIDYRELAEESQEALTLAYQGTASISRLFESEVSRQLVFVYAVPVMKDGEVQAVLAASDYVEIFEEALQGNAVLGGNGSVHLIKGDGRVLITTRGLQAGSHLFEQGYFSEMDLKKMYAVIGNEEKLAFVTMNDQGKQYVACLAPLGINDWYLLCIHDSVGANQTARSIIRTMAVTFSILMMMVLVLLVFICRLLFKSNRYLTLYAFQDRLTGADNMLRFEKNLEELREKQTQFCLVALNIRQFKFINEIFGEENANLLLRAVSKDIRANLAEGEFYARENADLFWLCLRQSEEEALRKRIESLIRLICQKETRSSKDYRLQMYGGAYIHDDRKEPGLSFEMLMTRTVFAMKYCKERPMEKLHFYDVSIHRDEEMENYVETHMHQALANGEFHVYLQPKKDMRTGKICGAEALVRWITDDGQKIFPDVFIPQFEKNGFCVKLDMYMFEQVCRMMREWLDRGYELISISVNQSKLLFFEGDYLETLQSCLEKYRIPANMLVLEILEGLALEHAGEVNDKLAALHKMGFKISMDDFGSGYASFNTLGSLDIDELKLDRSFLMEIAKGNTCRFRMIMHNIIRMSKELHIQTVAEGVETEADEDLIRMMGCDQGQGYLYSRPIPAEEFFETFIRQEQAAEEGVLNG